MSLIQCALKCKFQTDGYCKLETVSTVSSTAKKCPYFKSLDDTDGFLEVSDRGNLNTGGDA